MQIKIEEAKKEEIGSVLSLMMELSDYHKKIDPKYYKSGKERKERDKKRLIEYFSKKRKNRKILVAKVKNKIVGFLIGGVEKSPSYCKEKKIGVIYRAYVKENFRRRGIGKLLVEELLKWFRKRKIKFVEVEVDSRNKIGTEAYKKYGFFEFHKRMRLDL
jgi:ribosomal protein S18 acetylase RimI-like enzyme